MEFVRFVAESSEHFWGTIIIMFMFCVCMVAIGFSIWIARADS